MAEFNKGNKSRSTKRRGNRRGKDARDERAPYDKTKKGNRREEGDIPARNAGRTSSLNDMSWYSRNPALLVAAGQFPYPYRPGMALPLVKPTDATKYNPPSVPGIMVLDWVPSFSNSSSSIDPASVVGKEFYGRVRAAFSGTIDADAPDFVFYIGALDSIFTYIGWLKRVYRAISSYTPDNFMLPDGLLTAAGFSETEIQDLRSNKVLLWQGINELILQSRKFKCPAVMDLFNRHYWMSDNVYADADSPRAQLYMFNCTAVYSIGTVKEVSSQSDISGLVMKPIPDSPATGKTMVATLIDFGASLIQALDAWDDGYLIGGYLMKAFDSTPSFTIAELLQDELITVSYVPEVLMQIENSCTCLPAGAGTRNPWLAKMYEKMFVTQNTATNAVVTSADLQLYILTKSDFQAAFKLGVVQPALSIRSDAPTVADNVIASRLHAYCTYTEPTGDASFITAHVSAGTEVPIAWSIITRDERASSKWRTQMLTQKTQLGIGPVTGTQLLYHQAVFNLGQFDWHPFVYMFMPQNSANVAAGVDSGTLAINGDTHNMSVLTPADLENLHKICIYSELNSFGI